MKLVALKDGIDVFFSRKELSIESLDLKKNPLSFVQKLFTLSSIVERFQPDVIHCHMFHANVFCRLWKLFFDRRIPLICTAHSNHEGGALRMWLYRLTEPVCDLLTVVSKSMIEEIRKQPYRLGRNCELKYMPNGIDCRRFDHVQAKPSKTSGSFNVLAIGRLETVKNFSLLIEGFGLFVEKHPNSCLKIAGDGSIKKSLQTQIAQSNLEKHIELLGQVENVDDLLIQYADVFVSVSEFEGFGLALAEAILARCPFISSINGGLSHEVTSYGQCLKNPDAAAIANALVKSTIQKDTEKNELTLKAKQYVEQNYSFELILDKWEEIYTELIKKGNSNYVAD